MKKYNPYSEHLSKGYMDEETLFEAIGDEEDRKAHGYETKEIDDDTLVNYSNLNLGDTLIDPKGNKYSVVGKSMSFSEISVFDETGDAKEEYENPNDTANSFAGWVALEDEIGKTYVTYIKNEGVNWDIVG